MAEHSEFVRRSFAAVLGRPASVSEVEATVAALASGLSPLDWLISVVESPEARARRAGTSKEQTSDMDTDAPFDELAARFRLYSMTGEMNLYAGFNAARYVARNGIDGAIVECGVWRGGMSALMAATLLEFEAPHREVWLYDTFDGMVEPTAADVRHDGESAVDMWAGRQADADGWHRVTIDDVGGLMKSTGYPTELTRLVQGKVQDTIPGQAPEQIALLRLDTDWYDSTRHELVHLWDRLVPGGVLIVDDYGWWEGSRRAVDEFFGGEVLLSRIDPAGSRLAVKR
jgi:O-methyltransferase